METVLWHDIKTTKQGKIKDVGAFANGNELHQSNLIKLKNWIKECKIIGGNNITAILQVPVFN